MVVLPEPVAPTRATRWPGSTRKETFFRTGSPGTYANETSSNAIAPLVTPDSEVRLKPDTTGDFTSTGVSSSANIRSDEAIAPCNTLNFSDMSLIGLKNRCEYCRNATSDPSVSASAITRPPPYQMISDAASALTSSTAG